MCARTLIARIIVCDMNRAAEIESAGPSSKKRAADSPLENESAPSKKLNVTVETVKKWILENDKEIATSTWLVYDESDCEHVSALKCSVCIQCEDKLRSLRNYHLHL